MTAYPRNRVFVYVTIALLTLAIDLGSKEWIFRSIGFPCGDQPALIEGWLHFELFTSLNRGALWGIGQGFAFGFAILSGIAVCGIIYWLFFRNVAQSLWLTIALAMVTGGAIGNMYDRLGLHGVSFPGETSSALAVRDFLRFRFGTYEYPIFNLADSFLVAGAIMLMIHSFREPAVDPATTDLPESKSPTNSLSSISRDAVKGNG
jgi:signal peptidase II